MTADFSAARFNMIEGQIRPNKVTDLRLVSAMLELPRERFVSPALAGVAYVDEDLQIAPGRYLIEPMVLARLIQEAVIEADDLVLEIGAGSGYGTALLARLAGTVIAIEPDAGLRKQATDVLRGLGVENATMVDAPMADGRPGQGPFDVILINGAVGELPAGLRDQLADGGRLVMVEHPPGEAGRAVLISRHGEAFGRRVLFDAGTPVLPGLGARPRFVL